MYSLLTYSIISFRFLSTVSTRLCSGKMSTKDIEIMYHMRGERIFCFHLLFSFSITNAHSIDECGAFILSEILIRIVQIDADAFVLILSIAYFAAGDGRIDALTLRS